MTGAPVAKTLPPCFLPLLFDAGTIAFPFSGLGRCVGSHSFPCRRSHPLVETVPELLARSVLFDGLLARLFNCMATSLPPVLQSRACHPPMPLLPAGLTKHFLWSQQRTRSRTLRQFSPSRAIQRSCWADGDWIPHGWARNAVAAKMLAAAYAATVKRWMRRRLVLRELNEEHLLLWCILTLPCTSHATRRAHTQRQTA